MRPSRQLSPVLRRAFRAMSPGDLTEEPTVPTKPLTEGQRAYEAKRAAKAGMSLDKWLDLKEKEAAAEAKAKSRAEEKAREAAKPRKPPGFFSRLLERAHKPLGS